jgi:hypothetical protein
MLSSATTLLTEYYGASSLHTGNFGADEILLDGTYQLLQPSLGVGGSLYLRPQLQNPP